MTLSEVKNALAGLENLKFYLPNGKKVPAHFHVTEVGLVNKTFIDCGGTLREEQRISFQLFTSVDYHHRLAARKLEKIINIAERQLKLPDAEIEVEYQGETIGKYGLTLQDGAFHLESQQTACLAMDDCGIPARKITRPLEAITNKCEPNSGCC